MPNEVAVVTVTYASDRDIGDFLATVGASTVPVEVVVADNPSSSSAQTIAIATSMGAKVVRSPSNVGYGGAANLGVRSVGPGISYVLISNPDVRLEVDTIEKLAAALDAGPEIGLIGPLIRDADGHVYPSARRIPSLRTGIGHALFSRLWPTNPWTRAYRVDDADPTEPRDVGWLSGACFMVRRDVFDAVGGFDERYFMYFEDVDLGYRVTKAGWINRFDPSAAVTHTGAASTTTARREMLREHHASAYRFLSGKYRGIALAPLRIALFLALRARAWWLTR